MNTNNTTTGSRVSSYRDSLAFTFKTPAPPIQNQNNGPNHKNSNNHNHKDHRRRSSSFRSRHRLRHSGGASVRLHSKSTRGGEEERLESITTTRTRQAITAAATDATDVATTASTANATTTTDHQPPQPQTTRSRPNNSKVVMSDDNKSIIVLTYAVAWLSMASLAAHGGLLGVEYTNQFNLIVQDVSVSVVSAALAYLFVQFITNCVDNKEDDDDENKSRRMLLRLNPNDARKIIHSLSAPLFMALWPLFSNVPTARVFAVVVPLTNALRLYWAAHNHDSALAKAVSRSGVVSEARGGPLAYVLVVAMAMMLGWRTSPPAVIAITTMAAGDGAADLVGRRFGRNNVWPPMPMPMHRLLQKNNTTNTQKSMVGSLAFVIAATTVSTALLLWLQHWNCLTLPLFSEDWTLLVGRLALISVGAAFFELVPIGDDNYTVPISAAVLAMLLFPSSS